MRTEWNVRDSDATLVFKPPILANDKGTNWTIRCALKYKKKILIVDPDDKDAAGLVAEWLNENKIRVLNVAGPGENTSRGIGKKVYKILIKAFH